MPKIQRWVEDNHQELTNTEKEEIVSAIKAGYRNGRLDDEEGRKTYWELNTKTWREVATP